MLKDKIVKTAKGFPAIWEEGGGFTNTGLVDIITGSNGEKLEPIYIKSRGDLSCKQHALFLLKQGMYLIQVERYDVVYLIDVYQYQGEEFEKVVAPNYLLSAIEVAKEKTRHYHCRTPYYFIQKEALCDKLN